MADVGCLALGPGCCVCGGPEWRPAVCPAVGDLLPASVGLKRPLHSLPPVLWPPSPGVALPVRLRRWCPRKRRLERVSSPTCFSFGPFGPKGKQRKGTEKGSHTCAGGGGTRSLCSSSWDIGPETRKSQSDRQGGVTRDPWELGSVGQAEQERGRNAH